MSFEPPQLPNSPFQLPESLQSFARSLLDNTEGFVQLSRGKVQEAGVSFYHAFKGICHFFGGCKESRGNLQPNRVVRLDLNSESSSILTETSRDSFFSETPSGSQMTTPSSTQEWASDLSTSLMPNDWESRLKKANQQLQKLSAETVQAIVSHLGTFTWKNSCLTMETPDFNLNYSKDKVVMSQPLLDPSTGKQLSLIVCFESKDHHAQLGSQFIRFCNQFICEKSVEPCAIFAMLTNAFEHAFQQVQKHFIEQYQRHSLPNKAEGVAVILIGKEYYVANFRSKWAVTIHASNNEVCEASLPPKERNRPVITNGSMGTKMMFLDSTSNPFVVIEPKICQINQQEAKTDLDIQGWWNCLKEANQLRQKLSAEKVQAIVSHLGTPDWQNSCRTMQKPDYTLSYSKNVMSDTFEACGKKLSLIVCFESQPYSPILGYSFIQFCNQCVTAKSVGPSVIFAMLTKAFEYAFEQVQTHSIEYYPRNSLPNKAEGAAVILIGENYYVANFHTQWTVTTHAFNNEVCEASRPLPKGKNRPVITSGSMGTKMMFLDSKSNPFVVIEPKMRKINQQEEVQDPFLDVRGFYANRTVLIHKEDLTDQAVSHKEGEVSSPGTETPSPGVAKSSLNRSFQPGAPLTPVKLFPKDGDLDDEKASSLPDDLGEDASLDSFEEINADIEEKHTTD